MEYLTVPELRGALIKALGSIEGHTATHHDIKVLIRQQTGKIIGIKEWAEARASEIGAGRIVQINPRVMQLVIRD